MERQGGRMAVAGVLCSCMQAPCKLGAHRGTSCDSRRCARPTPNRRSADLLCSPAEVALVLWQIKLDGIAVKQLVQGHLPCLEEVAARGRAVAATAAAVVATAVVAAAALLAALLAVPLAAARLLPEPHHTQGARGEAAGERRRAGPPGKLPAENGAHGGGCGGCGVGDVGGRSRPFKTGWSGGDLVVGVAAADFSASPPHFQLQVVQTGGPCCG
jgi:hypothetical protein